MKRARLYRVVPGLLAALLVPACSDIPPGQPGPFADGAAVGGQMARATTVTSAESFATGSTTGTVAAATVVILAKHKATEQQRKIALARANATIKAKQQARAAKPRARKIPRYIAVDTTKDERTAPAAQKSVVIFDTETREIVGNNVYDVKSTPPVGGTAKFETFTAEYVGSGS